MFRTVSGLRDAGGIRAVQSLVPDALVGAFAAATHLGDPPLLAVLAVLAYWLGPGLGLVERRDATRLLAVVTLGLVVTTALKFGFAMPRPPASVRAVPAEGYGFPSGHAIGTTVAAGAAAAFLRVGRRRARLGLAAVVVAVVATSRVVIGVHYPIDVVAGVAVGVVVLAAGVPVARWRPDAAFATAALGGLAAGAIAWPTVDGAVAVGAPAGLAVGWVLAGRQRERRSGAERRGPVGGERVLVGAAIGIGVAAAGMAVAGADSVALALLAGAAGLLAGAVPGLVAVGSLLRVGETDASGRG